jgi:arabinan endo-1,5-alpha-L-arabinosidase
VVIRLGDKRVGVLASAFSILGLALLFTTCGGGSMSSPGSTTPTVFSSYDLTGAVTPVRDPSLMRQGNTYYVFSTDADGPAVDGSLPVLCSTHRVVWTSCGYVFGAIPTWVTAQVHRA